MVKFFASGAEIPLQMILSLRGLVNKGTYTLELLQKINNTNFLKKFLQFKPKHFASK